VRIKFVSEVSLFEEIRDAIKKKFPEFFDVHDDVEVKISRVPEGRWGFWAVNVFFQMAPFYKRSPEQLAEEAGKYLEKLSLISDYRVFGGYLNFHVAPDVVARTIKKLVESGKLSAIKMCCDRGMEVPSFFRAVPDFSDYPELEKYRDKIPALRKLRVLLEFVSANPTGPLHVGHGRCAAIGDSLARILSFLGFDVEKEYYVNDSGVQIRLLGLSVLARMKELAPSKVPGEWKMPQDGYRGEYIVDIAKRLLGEFSSSRFAHGDPESLLEYASKRAVEIILEDIKSDLKEFGVEFDNWFFEGNLMKSGERAYGNLVFNGSSDLEKVMELFSSASLIYEKDGAIWFRSTEFGDDKDRVLIRESGTPTYFGLDAAYHYTKVVRGYDVLFNVWGFDHHGYVKRLSSVVGVLKNCMRIRYGNESAPKVVELGGDCRGPVFYLKETLTRDLEEKDLMRSSSEHPDEIGPFKHFGLDFKVLLYQMVRLKRAGEPVAMSTRAGEFITLRQLREEVGNDAARFIYLTKTIDTPLDFDLELAKKKNLENPVYYVQYAHARCSSILKKAGLSLDEALDYFNQIGEEKIASLMEPADADLLSSLFYFAVMLPLVYQTGDPYFLTWFLLTFARDFHNFYANNRVIGSKNEEFRVAEVALVKLFLKTFLGLLGVSAPDEM